MTTLITIVIIALALSCSVSISVKIEEKDRAEFKARTNALIEEIDTMLAEDSPGQGKLKEPAMSYIAQETRKTHALMKELEAELEERSDPTRKTIPWGEPSRKAITSRDKPMKSDEIYEEPQATYPMEMKL